MCVLNCIQLSEAPWTAAHQAPLSMGFPRQEYWSGLPYPSPGDLPKPGIEPESSALAGGLKNTTLSGPTEAPPHLREGNQSIPPSKESVLTVLFLKSSSVNSSIYFVRVQPEIER